MTPPPQHPQSSATVTYTNQFLNSVLSQRSLPYSENLKFCIRNHLLSLSEIFPSLRPTTANFTHNNGETVTLLHADGTVPMVYLNHSYNIPVIITLLESYPRHAPLVRVTPTPDMVIKRHHPFVDPNGFVSIPYLQNWVYPSSNLVDLVKNLASYFGSDPPVYSKPPTKPNPNLNPNPSSSVSVRPATPPRAVAAYPASPYGSGSGSGSGRFQAQGNSTEDPAEVFKRNAVNKLVENLHSDIAGLRKAREGEMEGMFNAQAGLRRREEELRRGLREMQDEKEGLEQQLQMVLMNTDVLEGWVRDNEGKMGKATNGVDLDNVFEPVDGLSKQLMECTASDLAIEDVVYALDKAVQEGAIPFDQYLRNVRMLSREQFFHRATGSKVRAVQMQAQVASMAARAPQYAV